MQKEVSKRKKTKCDDFNDDEKAQLRKFKEKGKTVMRDYFG